MTIKISSMLVHRKVEFQGTQYWLHQSMFMPFCNLSPINHYDAEGNVDEQMVIDGGVSYAIVVGDKILRFEKVIGTLHDLKAVE